MRRNLQEGGCIDGIECWNDYLVHAVLEHTYMGWVDTLSRCRATSYTIHEFLLASPTMRYLYIKEEQVGIATTVFKRHVLFP